VTTIQHFEEHRDSLLSYGRDYNPDLGFFENFHELWASIPLPNFVTYGMNENLVYGDQCSKSKNVYLSFVIVGGSQNILYSFYTKKSVNVLNSVLVRKNS